MAKKMVHGVPLSMSRIPPRTKTSIYLAVEDMIDERMSKKHKEWLVRWKGFSHEDDTWEPLEHLSGCNQYIARFEEEHDHRTSLLSIVRSRPLIVFSCPALLLDM